MNQGDRADWAKDLDGHRRSSTPGGAFDHEYLYWVGCAGSFDDKNQKVTQAMAKLLQRAGIDFAILGPSEMCTGDPARRSGNEYLFQMLAMQNVETLNGMGVKKIITQCPHCFNTLLNEYPQLGGHYEVLHHSQLLEWLIETGKLDLRERPPRRAHHLPRLLLPRPPQRHLPRAPQGGRLARRHRGRRDGPQRHEGHVLRRRRRPHVDGGDASARRSTTSGRRRPSPPAPRRVATACPFCYIMLDDGVKGAGRTRTRSGSPTSPSTCSRPSSGASRRLPLPLRRSKTDQSHVGATKRPWHVLVVADDADGAEIMCGCSRALVTR